MIGQYLSNTNESANIPILQKNLELNKALIGWAGWHLVQRVVTQRNEIELHNV